MIQLLRLEVPRKFGEQVVDVLNDRLVLASLRCPHAVQVLQSERLLLDDEPKDLLQLLNVLDLVHGVTEDYF